MALPSRAQNYQCPSSSLLPPCLAGGDDSNRPLRRFGRMAGTIGIVVCESALSAGTTAERNQLPTVAAKTNPIDTIAASPFHLIPLSCGGGIHRTIPAPLSPGRMLSPFPQICAGDTEDISQVEDSRDRPDNCEPSTTYNSHTASPSRSLCRFLPVGWHVAPDGLSGFALRKPDGLAGLP